MSPADPARRREPSAAESVRLARWVVFTVLGGFIGLGAAGAAFVAKFERKSDAEEKHAKQDAIIEDHDRKLEIMQRDESRREEDMRWMRDQFYEIATATGARRVPAPKH
jgi:hypothetical protein